MVGTSNQLFIQGSYTEQNFRKNKKTLAKLRSLWYVHFVLPVLFVFALASDWAVLYGNVAFSILVLSTKRRYSSFLKKFFVLEEIGFKVKVLKTFKTSSDSQTEGYFKNSYYCFLEEPMLFLLALKWNLKKIYSIR